MNDTRAVIAAFEAGDELAVRRLGWWPVWEACATWWRPRQTATAKDMVAYAKAVGGEKPADVLAAIEALAGEWRPVPGAVRGALNRQRGEATVDVGRGRDRSAAPEALRAAAAALAAGEHVCGCGSPTSRTWHLDPAGVARCVGGLTPGEHEPYVGTGCGGIEPGQADNAEMLASTAEEAA